MMSNKLSNAIWRIYRDVIITLVDKLVIILPDVPCLKLQFRCRMGYGLNLNTPRSFSEKLQWLKLYKRDPLYTKLVDKYEVKDYIAKQIGYTHIISTLGVWESCNQINWDKLPEKFVLKTTHDGGSAGVYICKNKRRINKKKVCDQLSKSLKHSIYRVFREWPYKNVPPRIIAEEYMEQADGSGLIDYKFFCFNGVPQFLYVRKTGDNHSLNFVTMDWEKAPFRRSDNAPADELPPKPSQFDTMVCIAKKLSKGIPFVRVDLYEINNQVFFSELTFYPSSGLLPFVPQEWDYKLGDLLELPINENKHDNQ